MKQLLCGDLLKRKILLFIIF